MSRTIWVGVFALVLGFLGEAVRGDDAPAKGKAGGDEAPPAKAAAKDSEPEPFAKVKGEWDALDKQISQLVEKFGEAPADQREALRKQYMALIEKTGPLLARLRTSAIAAYKNQPNADKSVTSTMLGLLNNDLQSDNYGAASDLAQLLIDNKCAEKPLLSMAGHAAYGRNDFAAAGVHWKAAEAAGSLDPIGEAQSKDLPEMQKAWERELKVREKEAAANDLPRVKFTTSKGEIVIELFENEAPGAVANFVNLIEKKYYDGLTFHRVLAGFMAQGGCPKGDGTGGPGYHIACECEREDYRHHFAGTLSMAHAGKNTGGSQFFLTFKPTPHLDGRHTAFGRVIEGFDVLAKLQRRDPQRSRVEPDKIVKAEVLRKRDHAYEPKKLDEK
ncbi:MAG TPA: peptidylprolyl isomerase [Pirellulaceae bacterium]|nr:peptidylprolyl isomerase [Pirellulaceae bacterium]